jgi:hypothetical protein
VIEERDIRKCFAALKPLLLPFPPSHQPTYSTPVRYASLVTFSTQPASVPREVPISRGSTTSWRAASVAPRISYPLCKAPSLLRRPCGQSRRFASQLAEPSSSCHSARSEAFAPRSLRQKAVERIVTDDSVFPRKSTSQCMLLMPFQCGSLVACTNSGTDRICSGEARRSPECVSLLPIRADSKIRQK